MKFRGMKSTTPITILVSKVEELQHRKENLYHHPLGPPQPSQVLRFYSPSLATIYQHSLYTGIIYFSLQFQRDTPFCQHWR